MLNVINKMRDLYPLALAKMQSGEVLSDCVFNHHTCTPWPLVDNFWNNKQFDTFATANFEALLHPNILNTRYVRFYTPCSIKASYARMLLEKLKLTSPKFDYTIVKYTYDFDKRKVVFLMENDMPEFHGIFLNSPYSIRAGDSTNTVSVFPEFTNKFKPMATVNFVTILPRFWASMPNNSFRKSMFSDQQSTHLKELVCLDNNTFKNAQVNTCYAIFDMTKTYGSVVITDAKKQVATQHLDSESVIPWHDIRWTSVFAKIKQLTTLDAMWSNGSLNLKYIVSDPQGVEFITSVGSMNKPINIEKIKPGLETHGIGKIKVVFALVGPEDGIGPVKVTGKETANGHSVVSMLIDDADDNIAMLKAFRLQDYLSSSFVKQIVNAKKTSTPNSKHIFEYVPMPDLSKDFNQDDMFSLLGLNSDEKLLFTND